MSRPVDDGATAVLEVISPGLLSTIQDLGRPGLENVGVPIGGAADPVGLAVANLVLGNAPDMAAIECTLLGPELRVLRDVTVGIGGADLGGQVLRGGRRLPPGASHRLRAGEVLAFAAVEPDLGCRAYLAVPGGIDVPEVLGSKSTSLVGAFGGLQGRALRAGDRLQAHIGNAASAEVPWPADLGLPAQDAVVRVLSGPQATDADTAGIPETLAHLLGATWEVSHDSDRRGLRLDGPSLASLTLLADDPSQGVLPGAIQLTPSGQPIVLMPDGGTTGGYPVIAVVCAADLWLLGQLRPGSTVAFERIDAATARRAAEDLRQLVATAAERLSARLS
ncbi:MAG TPA: biotin-dependent carboxyltransferase family protein [Candidatus Eisenbacteria bacterium]|nr:biotin-dependent carboxyltransferase family protein [Candidatus Eisenbacteria bacterium]